MNPEARLRVALDESEAWARAASQTSAPGTPSGEHWQWECSHCDAPITINPVTDAYVECPNQCSAEVSLRSVEQYPTSSSYTLPAFIVSSTEEVPATAGALIVRHDPAAVLRMVAAFREILDLHEHVPDDGINHTFRERDRSTDTLQALARALGVPADNGTDISADKTGPEIA
jgi:hypothetical protein